MASIARRALALSGVIVAPLVALAAFGDNRGPLGIIALGWAALGLALVWLSWSSFSRRVCDLTRLADRMPDLRSARSYDSMTMKSAIWRALCRG
jgi:hypothetical protein